jgi:flagellar L-ring protein precursor FlgH
MNGVLVSLNVIPAHSGTQSHPSMFNVKFKLGPFLRRGAFVAAALLLGGCGAMRTVEIQQPLTARPAPVVAMPGAQTGGAIFQTVNFQPLFEDRRARYVGDVITIVLNEKLQASKQSGSNVDKSGSSSLTIPVITGHIPLKNLLGNTSVSGSSDTKFSGKGDSSSSNAFTGTITVTVIEVLGNGNLIVAGEKQIGINQGSEFIRFSGVVNPVFIVNNNTITSTQVADARIEYRGTGYIDEAQTMGWLSRLFMSVSPF